MNIVEVRKLLPRLQSLREAVEAKPENVEARIKLAQTYYAIGRFDESIEEYERVTKMMPDSWEAFNRLAIVYAEAGRFAESIEPYKRAAALKPNQSVLESGRCVHPQGTN